MPETFRPALLWGVNTLNWLASRTCRKTTSWSPRISSKTAYFGGFGNAQIVGNWMGLFLVGLALVGPAMAQAGQASPPATGLSPTCNAANHGESWVFRPSRFSHAPQTAERVVQYQPPPPAIVPTDPTYQESGYRHKRSGLAVRGSFDYRHVVETWGAGESIRPYGEWLYPFRPGATPFGPWGNPQGPWTLPFQSWQNPYGSWNRYGYPYGMVPIPVWPPAQAPTP